MKHNGKDNDANLIPSSTEGVSRKPQLDLYTLDHWSYAPKFLEDLPPPIPNGLPDGAYIGHTEFAPSPFKWEDAFEDLLIASQGRPLPHILHRYGQRILSDMSHPFGENQISWYRRLLDDNLVTAAPYLDLNPRLHRWSLDPNFPEDLVPKITQLLNSLGGRSPTPVTDSILEELVTSLREREDQLKSEDTGRQRQETLARLRQPEHFEDLASDWRSRFSEADRSWDAFKKAFGPHSHEDEGFDSAVDKTKTVVEEERTLDRHGQQVNKVKKQYFDKDGNEIGVETIITSSSSWGGSDEDRFKAPKSDGKEPEKKSGWFWW